MTPGSEKTLRFPLDDVKLKRVDKVRNIEKPAVSNKWMALAPLEFSMTVDEVGSFYAKNGNYVEYSVEIGAMPSTVELFLNGSIYGAILHQRAILPIHGSSFIFDGNCVMLCGHSGSGKSSLTASFCINGGQFLTDDVTPILFDYDKPEVWPRSGRIKLWEDSLEQLGQRKEGLAKIREVDEKYYYELESSLREPCPLHHVLILGVTDTDEVTFRQIQKTEAFTYLHKEIYRREFLGAMPKTESAYLKKISTICNRVPVTRVGRPASISIDEMRQEIADFIHSE
ncbi:MAG: hypothetical protein GVY02_04770 [Bacteroidetes bacterium]|jgi:hypothetical protein|nr:hypothetical protein [Bacteroidota bacterium]